MPLFLATTLVSSSERAYALGPSQEALLPEESAALRPGTVAVVPFANISGQADDDWLGAGIAETVTADLQQFSALSVVGRAAFLDAADNTETGADLAPSDEAVARGLAGRLGVEWIVTGGFQRLGDQLRITARIVNVETGDAYQTAKLDGSLDEVFVLQDRVVTELRAGFEGISGERGPSTLGSASGVAPDGQAASRDASGQGQRPGGRAHLGEVSKDPAVDGLLLERAIPALDDAVGFGLFNEAEAGVDAPVRCV